MKIKEHTKNYLLLGLICLFSTAAYLIIACQIAGVGFPLDDAWIHQVFARNFAGNLEWSFQSGQASGGSTGPGYGILLSGIYALDFPPVWGTHLIGFGMLWGLAVGAYKVVGLLLPEKRNPALIVGMIIALEWHLVWSALSGMETLLLGIIAMYLFWYLARTEGQFWVPGILVALAVWIRPDGVTLTGPVLMALFFRSEKWRDRFWYLAQFVVCLVGIGLPYFLFNQVVAGEIWPNTFFAKQAEYAALQEISYLVRLGRMWLQPLTGIGIVLLAGLVFEGLNVIRTRDWVRAGFLLWVVGYIGLYAWRLPVTYQHGRYVMPAMPIFFLLGGVGLLRVLQGDSSKAGVRVLSRTALGAGTLVLVIFWGLGARAYALDVGVIETEMVQTARWINANTPSAAVIGAHDIGALGYYADREIVDLAGLISPDVIPFIRDQEALAAYLDQRRVSYLMTFPGWYPDLVPELLPVYAGTGEFSYKFDMDPMTVYKWP